MSVRRRPLLLVIAGAACVAAVGCASEEKVVRYKPFLAGLKPSLQEGMTLSYGQEPVGDLGPKLPPGVDADPGTPGEMKIVIENPDGTKKLVSRTPKHVMMHVERCLDEGEDDLLLDQIVSSATKDYYQAQGKSPREFIDWLRLARKDIARLFSRMPQGESSPTVILRQLPDRTWRIDVVGGYAKDLRFTRLWLRMEKGEWKLMWID